MYIDFEMIVIYVVMLLFDFFFYLCYVQVDGITNKQLLNVNLARKKSNY